ncbi:hypothetical protein [Hymenobacter sp. APR13]|uniref:hypothetical protein n=1 Tax=Hymenobacter sp. APR13 TaxID=1356852 RepID=UPI0012E07D6B|nr:hypothetical protein [Hymenobacter sp. APR13]
MKENFDEFLYYNASGYKIIDYQDFLDIAIKNSVKGSPQNIVKNGLIDRGRAVFFPNIINFMDGVNADVKRLLNEPVEYSDFQLMLIDPESFDYNKFDPEWLLVIYDEGIIKKINEAHNLGEYIMKYIKTYIDEKEKKKNIDKLTRMYFKFIV